MIMLLLFGPAPYINPSQRKPYYKEIIAKNINVVKCVILFNADDLVETLNFHLPYHSRLPDEPIDDLVVINDLDFSRLVCPHTVES